MTVKTRTSKTRTALAAAILAALPLATGTLQSDAIRSADGAETRNVAEHAPGPQWSYAVGEGLNVPQLLACPSGRWSCLLYML